jgi:hypothetical protein
MKKRKKKGERNPGGGNDDWMISQSVGARARS